MTKKDLFRKLQNVPDDAEMFLSEIDMPGMREISVIQIGWFSYGMGGAYFKKTSDPIYPDDKMGVKLS